MYRNPSALLKLDEEPAVRLLLSAGADESTVRNGSDYDRFAALAAAMPVCHGHARTASMLDILQDATGLTLPLCPHTAPIYWRRWVETDRYGRDVCVEEPARPCGSCTPVPPTVLHRGAVALPIDPIGLAAHTVEPTIWEERLQAEARGRYASVVLPTAFAFRRPDPYHAALALHAVAEERATLEERNLLLAQALRILGGCASARSMTLLLRGGAPDAVLALLGYLNACDRLPATVWFPDNPADAAYVSGLYASVGTGYTVSAADSEADRADIRAAYAASAPIGRAVEWHM